MEKERIYALFVATIAIYLLAYFKLLSPLPFNWFSVKEQSELKLLEYDKTAYDKLSFTVFSSEERDCSLKMCEDSRLVHLKEGENYFEEVNLCQQGYVEVDCSDSSVHFTFDLMPEENLSSYIHLSTLELTLEPAKVVATVNGEYSTGKNSYRLVNFFIDGKLVRSVQHLFEAGRHSLEMVEDFQLYPGRHTVSVNISKSMLQADVEIPSGIPVAEYTVLVFSFCLSVYVSRKYRLSLLNSFLIFVTLTAFLLILQFQLSRNLGYTYAIYSVLALFALVLPKEKLRFPKVDVGKALAFALLATLACVVARTFIGSAILTSHYYLRQTDLTYLHGSTKYFDELSYLGRYFSYPSQAFFMLTSTVAKLLFTIPSAMIFNFHTVLIFLFALTLYLTTVKLKSRERLLVSLTIFSNYFILTLLLSSPLHALAFLMLTLSVYFYVTGNKLLCITSLATATASHLTILVAFPLFAYAADNFKARRNILLCLLAAGLIASIFYLPLIIKLGLPYQILPKEKGFLQTYGLFGSFVDFNLVFPLIPLTILFGIFDKRYRIAVVIFLLALLVYMFISYRMNVLSLFMLPFLFVSVFRKLDLKLLLLLPIASVFMVFLFYSGFTERCEYGAVNQNCIKPMQFIDRYTSSNDRVVANPIFGHLEAYYGKRKVLADVFVEYADREKYEAAKEFSQTRDKEVIDKYGITIAVTENIGKNDIEFDKIYDNKLFNIYRLR